ncbi:hypothetical protein [Phenylobacterium sp.]|uniref:hypothetical protein n=1 Tax=Phenylobacterium sp. TaxID=1871053 RepID=UPI0027313863|nr:hypothetical protein [Phenylobacterium sp.]MDP2214786.1 hypothetical protein [Phenylobacterium sp.]
MAKIRLEWLAMASVDSARGQIENAAQRVYGTQALDAGADSIQSEQAPAFEGARGLARVIVQGGAAYVAWGDDPTADAEGLLVYPGDPQLIAVKPGERLAFLAAPSMVDPVGASGLITFTATILAGQFESDEIDLGSAKLVSLDVLHPWTNADIGFAARQAGGAFAPVFDRYNTREIIRVGEITASRRIGLALSEFGHLSRFKIQSLLAGVAVNQALDRVITITAQP